MNTRGSARRVRPRRTVRLSGSMAVGSAEDVRMRRQSPCRVRRRLAAVAVVPITTPLPGAGQDVRSMAAPTWARSRGAADQPSAKHPVGDGGVRGAPPGTAGRSQLLDHEVGHSHVRQVVFEVRSRPTDRRSSAPRPHGFAPYCSRSFAGSRDRSNASFAARLVTRSNAFRYAASIPPTAGRPLHRGVDPPEQFPAVLGAVDGHVGRQRERRPGVVYRNIVSPPQLTGSYSLAEVRRELEEPLPGEVRIRDADVRRHARLVLAAELGDD